MNQKSNDLIDFMRAITQDMAHEYDRIQKRAAEDPGTAGDQGEENWANLLRGWLPPTYQIVTKGRILSHEGTAGPQVDVLVLSPVYPNHLLDKKLYLAGGVAAAFECKVTLKSDHIRKAIENSVEIRRLLPARAGSPYRELHSSIVYGLLAHSHVWKNKGSKPLENIEDHLIEADNQIVEHPRETLDLLCVADLATWVSARDPYVPPEFLKNWSKSLGVAATAYTRHAGLPQDTSSEGFTPIGTMVSRLLYKLAWEDTSTRRLAEYFSMANLTGSGVGKLRPWDAEMYSQEVKRRLLLGPLTSEERWDEWSRTFERLG